MNVSNRKYVRRVSVRALWAARSRNIIAVLAIALTTVLFTTLFTMTMSINSAMQQSSFMQVGGYSHGGFKYLTAEQLENLKDDPLITAYGIRRFVGMPKDAPFVKNPVEIGYSNANTAKWMYTEPTAGRLPTEGTNEAATETRVLSLLGVKPELGAAFTMTFDVDGEETTETFTLSGWWESEYALPVSHVLIPESRAEEIFQKLGTEGVDGMTTFYNMDVMLASAMHIERDLETVLANNGYHSNSGNADGYIDYGVNWAYTGAQLSAHLDFTTAAALAGILILIVFTGYLIIYNIFQISVTGDIRFYGLLKTIGTTARQLRRIIRIQALALSIMGIPLGLLAGYGVGVFLTPVVLSRLNGVAPDTLSVSPFIFIGSAVFSLVTVLISCRKPGRMAAKVSPVEAVRYTEASGGKKTLRRADKPASLPKMAFANLGRSRKKTVITVVSLSLAVVLLNMTVTFASGFDMDKFVSKQMVADFIIADAAYFNVGTYWSADRAVPEETVRRIETMSGVTGGRTYGLTVPAQQMVTEEYFRAQQNGYVLPEGAIESLVAQAEKLDGGMLADGINLYGMEAYARGKLNVLEGDLSKLDEPGGRYIAARFDDDDYGVPHMDSNWVKVGDTLTVRYVEEVEYYDAVSGEPLPDGPESAGSFALSRAKVYRDVDYEVAALVTLPHSLGYRYYGSDEFIMNAETFQSDTGTSDVMYYACDTADEDNAAMEAFLRDYTRNIQPQYGYESKASYAAEFRATQNMFLILGGMLSFIVGLVGILNFLNAVLTGIFARRREFAVLQSIGMTGGQLKTMLVWEGLYYTLSSLAVTLVLSACAGPLAGSVMGGIVWFFTYRFTVVPILAVVPVFALLGLCLPLLAYRYVAGQSIIERLREAEG